jgi:hypothetical protein
MISNEVDSDVAKLIRRCWQNDASLRPEFREIYGILKDE